MAISDRQIEERKMRQERILDGALEVFKTKGLENSTMEEIASKAGFGKATLYYYFQSKEDVFSAILHNGWQMLWISLEPVIAEGKGARNTFVQVLLKIAENIRHRPGLFEFLYTAPKAIVFDEEPWKKYQERMYGTLNSLLEDGIQAKEFPQMDSKLLFKALGGLFMGLVLIGEKENPVSEKDIEHLLNQLIMNPIDKT